MPYDAMRPKCITRISWRRFWRCNQRKSQICNITHRKYPSQKTETLIHVRTSLSFSLPSLFLLSFTCSLSRSIFCFFCRLKYTARIEIKLLFRSQQVGILLQGFKLQSNVTLRICIQNHHFHTIQS